eukprot:9585773-Karenia_brevis.AAC.1
MAMDSALTATAATKRGHQQGETPPFRQGDRTIKLHPYANQVQHPEQAFTVGLMQQFFGQTNTGDGQKDG